MSNDAIQALQTVVDRGAAQWIECWPCPDLLTKADRRSPPVDGSDSAAAVLRAVHAVARPEELDLSTDNAAPDICARLIDATARRKQAEADEKLARNQLTDKLCGHTLARIQGFQVRVAVTPAKEPAAAPDGYMLPARKEVRRVTVKEWT